MSRTGDGVAALSVEEKRALLAKLLKEKQAAGSAWSGLRVGRMLDN